VCVTEGNDLGSRSINPHLDGRMSKRKLTLSLAQFRQTGEAIPKTHELPTYKG